MFAIAGGILLALFVLGLLVGGVGMLNEGETGCGCTVILVGLAIIGLIFL